VRSTGKRGLLFRVLDVVESEDGYVTVEALWFEHGHSGAYYEYTLRRGKKGWELYAKKLRAVS
jgi:hypothetical protein